MSITTKTTTTTSKTPVSAEKPVEMRKKELLAINENLERDLAITNKNLTTANDQLHAQDIALAEVNVKLVTVQTTLTNILAIGEELEKDKAKLIQEQELTLALVNLFLGKGNVILTDSIAKALKALNKEIGANGVANL